jgi:hypothetical protein
VSRQASKRRRDRPRVDVEALVVVDELLWRLDEEDRALRGLAVLSDRQAELQGDAQSPLRNSAPGR